MRNSYYISLIIIVGLVLATGCSKTNSQTPTLSAATDKQIMEKKETPILPKISKESWAVISHENLRQAIPIIGNLYPKQTTKLGPRINSRVQELLVDVGDEVKKGQKIAILDPSFFKIEVSQREAEIKIIEAKIVSIDHSFKTLQSEIDLAKISLEDADLQLTRMKNLWEKTQGAPSIPQKNYDDAVFRQKQAAITVALQESRLVEAKARLTEANCSLKQGQVALSYAKRNLEETIIYAPYNGVISARLVDTGEIVTSTPVVNIVEIQEIETLRLEFTLPQNLMSFVQKGTTVEFEVDGIPNSKTIAEIDSFFPSLDESTRSLRCRVFVKNQENKFRPGLLVKIQVIVKELNNVLTVPRRALSQTEKGWKVLVEENGTYTERFVKIGFMGEEKAEVQEGLKEGEKVRLIQ